MKQEIVCINCPMGCRMDVTVDDETRAFLEVSGNSCARGAAYAEKEVTAPERVLTTTVRVSNGTMPLVSVKSNAPLPKGQLFACMDILNDVLVNAPVFMGEPIIRNILDTGVDIVATSEVF